MVSISSQSSQPLPPAALFASQSALGLNMRTPGNEGFHLVRPKGRAVSFANQTSYHATRVPQLWWERVHIRAGVSPLFHRRNTNSTLGPASPSVFGEFTYLAGLRSLVTSNLHLAEDQM